MKHHLYHLPVVIFIGVLFLCSSKGYSFTQTVNVGNNFFSPNTFTISFGDTVRWVWNAGGHTTTSQSVPAGAATWNSAINSVVTSFKYVPTVLGTYNYQCTIHGAAMSGNFTVTCPVPAPTISATGSTTFCSGGSVTLQLSSGSFTGYQWKKGGVNVTGATNSTFSANQTGSYTLTVTNSCGSTGTSSAIPVTVQTSPSPAQATISAGGPITFCSGGSVNLSVATAGLTYLWKRNNSAISGATAQSFSANQTGSYTCDVSNNCGPTTSNSINVTVNSLPTASISPPGPISLCTGDNVILTASANTSYLWSTGATTQSITVTNQGDYFVNVTNSSGCSATSTSVSVIVNACAVTLHLKLFIEGYYNGGGTMQPVLYNEGLDPNPASTKVDTIRIELHDQVNTASVVSTYVGLLQTDGTITCTFPSGVSGQSCYIVIRHRNALQTWSSLPVLMSSNTSYDFSSSVTKAFGNNMIDLFSENIWSVYSGDFDQNESIDIFDFPLFDADASNFLFGYYLTDLNGDGNTDIFDFPVFDANLSNFIFSNHP